MKKEEHDMGTEKTLLRLLTFTSIGLQEEQKKQQQQVVACSVYFIENARQEVQWR